MQPLVHALNELLARLDAALDAQRAFIADAAHELRTPLTAVHLQAQLAERATSDAERAAALAALQRRARRARRAWSSSCSTLARAEEPGVGDAAGPVDLAALARAVVAEHGRCRGGRDVDLGLAGAGERRSCHRRGRGLRTLLRNLVDNAIRYTPAGGGSTSASSGATARRVLAVRDTGPGIPPAERARVFDRFYRRGRDATVPGSGLGLAIVKRDRRAARGDRRAGRGPGGRGLGVVCASRFHAAAAS